MSINERVAKVKGWKRSTLITHPDEFLWTDNDGCDWLFDWSGRIADAWELRDELVADSWIVVVVNGVHHSNTVCRIENGDHEEAFECPTAPEAICLAWLAAME